MREDKKQIENLLNESKVARLGKAKTLNQYAQLFGQIIGAEEDCWRWIGDGLKESTFSVLEVGESYYFDFSNVQLVVDRLEEWLERYGNLHGVAYEVLEWHEWTLRQVHEDEGYPAAIDVFEWKFERFMRTRPAINLESWLMGCPREIKKDIRHEERILQAKMQMVAEMIGNYGSRATLAEVLKHIDDDIGRTHADVLAEDKRIQQAFLESDKWKQLKADLDEAAEMERQRMKDEEGIV